MAKSNLKNLETWRARVGGAVARTFELAGLSQKEGAALLERDQAQVARWVSGAERMQADAVLSVERLRQPFVIAMAELGGAGVDIVTEIRVRRIA